MILDILVISMLGLFMATCITGTILLVMDAEDRWERKKRKRK
jgi:hypothetical protein